MVVGGKSGRCGSEMHATGLRRSFRKEYVRKWVALFSNYSEGPDEEIQIFILTFSFQASVKSVKVR